MKHFILLSILSACTLYSFSQTKIDTSDIRSAAKIMSMEFTSAEIDSMQGTLQNRMRVYDKMHRYDLENATPLTLAFSPVLPGMQ